MPKTEIKKGHILEEEKKGIRLEYNNISLIPPHA